METLLILGNIVFAASLIGFAIWAWNKSAIRSRILLNSWVVDNGVTLVRYETRFFRKGPYWKTSGSQRVLRVTVLDENNTERTGWILCGSRFKGTLSDDVVGILDELNGHP